MKCPYCGAENPTEASFCSRCAAHLGGASVVPLAELVLAKRTTRLAAWIIDVPFSPASFLIAMYLPALPGSGFIATALMLVATALRLVAVVAIPIQVALLSRYGQTIGKRALGLRIVRIETGLNGGFLTNVVLRTVVNWLLCLIPPYVIVDSLLILTASRRCIHDYIAGTRVVLD